MISHRLSSASDRPMSLNSPGLIVVPNEEEDEEFRSGSDPDSPSQMIINNNSSNKEPKIATKLSEIYDQESHLNEFSYFYILFSIGIVLGLVWKFYFEHPSSEVLIYSNIRQVVFITLGLIIVGAKRIFSKKIETDHAFGFVLMLMIILRISNSVFLEKITKKFSFEFDLHMHSSMNDECLIALILALICLRFSFKELYLRILLFSASCLTISNIILCGISFDRFFHLKFYLNLLVLQASLFFGYLTLSWRHFFTKREKKKIKRELEKEAKIINEKFQNFKKNIEKPVARESNFNQSKADHLLMKLKYLKFQALIHLNDNIKSKNPKKKRESIGVDYSPVNRKRVEEMMSKKSISSNILASSANRRPSKSIYNKEKEKLGRRDQDILLQKVEAYDYSTTQQEVSKEDDKWILTPEDVDEIMKGIINKPNMFWLPKFLAPNHDFEKESKIKNPLNQEAKDFVLNHFTEKSFEFSSHMKEFQPSQKKLRQFIECNPDSIEMSPLNKYLLNVCENWNYDVFILRNLTKGNVVVEFGYCIFKKFGVDETFNITDKRTITNFLSQVQSYYKPNPYHNAMHAVDVTNSVGFFLAKGLSEKFSSHEISALIISALAHDLGHPGLNNAFLLATKSTQAMIYNDQSVLENYHSAALFQILHTEGCDVVKNLSEKDWRYFRKNCILMILDTDLQKHFVIMNKFKSALSMDNFDLNDEQNRNLALSITLKCADIGHGAKSLDLHKKWSRRIIEEFYQQGDLEIKNKIPVSPLCDRKANISKSQEGFLKVIVLPLYEIFEQFFGCEEVRMACSHQIKANLEYWQEQMRGENEGNDSQFLNDTKEVVTEIADSLTSIDNQSTFSAF